MWITGTAKELRKAILPAGVVVVDEQLQPLGKAASLYATLWQGDARWVWRVTHTRAGPTIVIRGRETSDSTTDVE